MTITTEEKYMVATNSSNLRIEADRAGHADVLIAAGWSSSRIGSALMRLHSKPDATTLEAVHINTAMHAKRLKVDKPDLVASAVISWWIDRICKTCHGRKYETIDGAPSTSDVRCPVCNGSGESRLPHGESGRKIASWLDDCKSSAVDSIKRRLRYESK